MPRHRHAAGPPVGVSSGRLSGGARQSAGGGERVWLHSPVVALNLRGRPPD